MNSPEKTEIFVIAFFLASLGISRNYLKISGSRTSDSRYLHPRNGEEKGNVFCDFFRRLIMDSDDESSTSQVVILCNWFIRSVCLQSSNLELIESDSSSASDSGKDLVDEL